MAYFIIRSMQASLPTGSRDEPLVSQHAIEASGIICRPFWHEDDLLEGAAYDEYITANPDFYLAVRQTVLMRLHEASKKLPIGWRFVLKAGYRPASVQRRVFEVALYQARQDHPQWSDEQCLNYARRYVSDPDIMTPPHCTGGAIDIDVVDQHTGSPVDFGCAPNTTAEVAALDAPGLTVTQQANRKILLDAMHSAGFAPLSSEWWHFQYGEQLWADYYQEHAIYGVIDEV